MARCSFSECTDSETVTLLSSVMYQNMKTVGTDAAETECFTGERDYPYVYSE